LEAKIPILERIVFDEDENLSFYELSKKEGFYDVFMESPEAIEEYVKEKIAQEEGLEIDKFK